VEIDAVEQGTGESTEVAGPLGGCAGAGGQRGTAAAAGVGGGDELEPGGKAGDAGRAGDDDPAVFQGLAEGLQNALGELGQLVHEEHAVMGEADLAGVGHPAADETGLRGGVMRAPERAHGEQAMLGREQARDTPDGGGLDGFVQRQRRQDGGDAAGEHGLAGAGWPDHQDDRTSNEPEPYLIVIPTIRASPR
jgi:hypothetical protein